MGWEFCKGLKRIDLRTYAVKHYDNIASDIFSICRITAGDLYLGTTIGLFRYNPDTERFKRVPRTWVDVCLLYKRRISRGIYGWQLMPMASIKRMSVQVVGNISYMRKQTRPPFHPIRC